MCLFVAVSRSWKGSTSGKQLTAHEHVCKRGWQRDQSLYCQGGQAQRETACGPLAALAQAVLCRASRNSLLTTAWHHRRCWLVAGTMRAACTGLLAVLALAALRGARAQTTTYAPEVGDGWRRGRATFFGGDERFLSNFPDRGPPPEYGFGNIRYGSCGYYQQARAGT